MSDNRNGLAVTLAVVGGCLGLFLVIVLMLATGGEEDANPAVGFPIVLVGLAVVAVVTALVWRVVSRKRSDR